MADETPRSSAPILSSTRKKIQAEIERAERERRKQIKRKRMELAQGGLRAYNERRYAQSTSLLLGYLKLAEESKGVAEGGLQPSHFDPKEDAIELLLISGVYWDLAKLLDRAKSEGARKKCRHYLEKFILFSKGKSFEAVSAETLRKYVSNDKPIHRNDFRSAYRVMTGTKCFVVTSLQDHVASDTLGVLRGYRDERLARTRRGRLMIRVYYGVGPLLAAGLDRAPEPFRAAVARAIDALAARISAAQGVSAERCRSAPAGR